MTLKTITIYAGIFVLGFAFGSASMYFYFKRNIQMNIANNINKNQIRNTNTNINNHITPKIIKTKYIAGTITNFFGNKITIKTNSISNVDERRTVTIITDEKTKFLSIIPKDIKIFQQELKDFQNGSNKSSIDLQPKPFIEKEVSKDMFTVGKIISVKSISEFTNLSSSVNAESVSLLPEGSKFTK